MLLLHTLAPRQLCRLWGPLGGFPVGGGQLARAQSSLVQAHRVSGPQVLRQLQQGLAKCYSVAFEKSGAVSDAKITPHTLNFVKKLVSTFGVGLENVSNVSTMFSSAASVSLARRAQATAQDPVFQNLKGQFTTGES